MVFSFSDNQKVGLGLTTLAGLFTMLGVMMFFDRGLLALGNFLFMGGVTLLIGPGKTASFFFQMRKLRATACFLGGALLVLMGWTFIGFCVESVGFFQLFFDFFPYVLKFARSIPVLSTVLNLPGVKQLVDRIVHGGSLPV